MQKRGWLWAGGAVTLCTVAVLGAVLGTTLSFSGKDQVCQGVTIEGVSVGGLTRQQCEAKMRDWAVAASTRRVVLAALDARWMGAVPDFGARFEWRKAVDQAFAVGRQGTLINRAACVLTSGGRGKQIKVPVVVDRSKITKAVSKIAKAVNRPHRDARLAESNGTLIVTQDSKGIKLDEKKALDAVERALKSAVPVASLPVVPDLPDVTTEDAAGINTLLARFTTSYNPTKRDRTHNLVLAAREINGIIIKQGKQFSYNDAVGPRVVARGFREAPIFVRGKMEPGVGGGICQVSSTLYNAVLMTGLKVVERHNHSRVVPYVTAGRDATVAFGLQDFRFENPLSTPVGILTHMGNSSLTVDIYGAATDKKDISVFTGPVTYTPNTTQTVMDPKLPPGVRRIVDKGARGARVTVYRKIRMADGSYVTETVSKDRYRPQPVIVGVGVARSAAAGSVAAATGAGAGVTTETIATEAANATP